MIRELMKSKKSLIDQRLKSLLKADRAEHKTLFDAMNYSLLAGGKRIRPSLFLIVLDMLGVDSSRYIDTACTLECIHTYSLIHDDLPAMDNDDFRRGVLTNHKVFGAGMATQAGDGLLTFAFELLASQEMIPAQVRIKLVSILARAAGPCGMVGGQAHDLKAENRNLSLKELQILDAAKTGCLLMAPVKMALTIAGADQEVKEALEAYSFHLGILFQITDDLLDIKGSLDEMGKMPGQDVLDHKSTYATILGPEQAFKAAEKEAEEAKKAICNISCETDALLELVDMILSRSR